MVLPGLTDSHCNVFGIGEREIRFNLEGRNSLEDSSQRLKSESPKLSAANGLPAAAEKHERIFRRRLASGASGLARAGAQNVYDPARLRRV